MLRWRLIAAACILAPLFLLLYADYAWNFGHPGLILFPLTILTAVLAANEVLVLLGNRDLRPLPWVVYLGVLMVTLSASAPLAYSLAGSVYPPDCPVGTVGLPLVAFALTIPLAFAGEMQRYRAPGNSILNVALALFAIGYVGVSYAFLVLLRFYHDNEWGMAALLSVVAIVKSSDIGAYTVGRICGRHKMTPLISPGKTFEGGVGGLVTGMGVAWLFFQYAVPAIVGLSAPVGRWYLWLAYGALMTVAGMLGDLAESLLKRDMGMKDSSTWLKGLGGVLDIVDSLLLSAPLAYLCWASGMVGP